MISITKEEVHALLDDHNLIKIHFIKDGVSHTRFFIKPDDDILQIVNTKDKDELSLDDILNDDSIEKEISYTKKPKGY